MFVFSRDCSYEISVYLDHTVYVYGSQKLTGTFSQALARLKVNQKSPWKYFVCIYISVYMYLHQHALNDEFKYIQDVLELFGLIIFWYFDFVW